MWRVCYEFKVSPLEVLRWPVRVFDEACAYLKLMDDKQADAASKAKAQQAPQFMGGNRRRR